MEIKDYIHLHVGCKVKVGNISTAILTIDNTDEENISLEAVLMNKNYKLMLRPLSNITDEEKGKAASFLVGTQNFRKFSTGFPYYAQCTYYLLSKGFDVFGLIDAGIAIDATKLKPVS